MNGNGNGTSVTEASEDGPKENIFLFWPNIIGSSVYQAADILAHS